MSQTTSHPTLFSERLSAFWFVKMVFLQQNSLILYHILTLSDASAADDFWKHCGKGRNCSKREISPFVTMFTTFCINYTFIYRDFQFFCQLAFKVICCRFAVCGKGLISLEYHLPWTNVVNGLHQMLFWRGFTLYICDKRNQLCLIDLHEWFETVCPGLRT